MSNEALQDERRRVWRQLDALTLAARDLEERARGATERAEQVAACAAQVERLAAAPPEAPDRALAELPDPPTARILAHRWAADGDWSAVGAEARRLAELARQTADDRAREHADTEALRAEAERRVAEIDAALAGR